MSLSGFLNKIKQNQPLDFKETMAVIEQNYNYQATEFRNGLNDNVVTNAAGTNEGSCKIFAFAQINKLDQQQTLNLFGDYYRLEVLQDPQGSSHLNIRNFMQYGWSGIAFTQPALKPK